MTKEQSVIKLLEMRPLVLASFEAKKWIPLHLVSSHVDAYTVEAMEEHGLIEVKAGHTKPTAFRIKAAGYKYAVKYR